MKPLFHKKLNTTTTVSLFAVFSLFFSSELLASGCSKADIDYYLQKGFNHDQVTKLCSIAVTTAPSQAPIYSTNPQASGIKIDESFLTSALNARNVKLTPNQLSYKTKECEEYHPYGNFKIEEVEVCVNSKVTINLAGLQIKNSSKGLFLINDATFIVAGNINREYINFGKVRRQDKSDIKRLLPNTPKEVSIPIRRGFDPEEVAERLKKYIR